MKDKFVTFFKTLPSRTWNYLKNYFKHLNYPLWISAVLLAVGLFLTDYFSKINAFYYLTDGNAANPTLILNRQGTTIIPGVLEMTFVVNDGAAWGSFPGKMWALCIVSTIASIALTFNLLFRFDKYNKIMMSGVVLMAPGAIGNLVDRIGCLAGKGIYQHGVIDFLKFSFWDSFPICNLADYYLSIGVVLLLIGFIIEFRKEYKALKEEEEAEKRALAEGTMTEKMEEEENLKQKLITMDKESEEQVDSSSKGETDESGPDGEA